MSFEQPLRSPSLKLNLRIESQDAWMFQVPLPRDIVDNANYFMGQSKCDNMLASLFSASGYEVHNPAFAIRAIEVDSRGRNFAMYESHGGNFNTDDSSFVLFSDKFASSEH